MESVEEAVKRHIENVIKGDTEAALADLTPEVKAGAGPLLEKLGEIQPTKYEIIEIEDKGDEGVARYKYIGKGELPLEVKWKKIEGVWKVVGAKPL
ncbi:MAG: nuclear transport factor 2-like protein [Candidatus Methanospirareceae archaeon]